MVTRYDPCLEYGFGQDPEASVDESKDGKLVLFDDYERLFRLAKALAVAAEYNIHPDVEEEIMLEVSALLGDVGYDQGIEPFTTAKVSEK